ncbi:MAG: UDP-N-acetylglucosamine 4,6-dehydratase (inverting) [Bacteroidota bacterium]
MAIDLSGQSILVTGGTGSFGRDFIKRILLKFPSIKQLIIFSRDELKQFEMAQYFSEPLYSPLRYVIGDVRDAERLRRVCRGVDIIIHAAALKQVPAGEKNPMEFVKTNVHGAENVIQAAIDCGVKKVVALSTDKAAAPANLYGATKLCAEKLFIAASQLPEENTPIFSLVRYGNVLGSRGSVAPLFISQRTTGVLSITHPEMTRFSITPDEEVDLILYALENAWGGEIFVPKLPSYHITDLAEVIAPECQHKFVGIRPGEKLHEEMITETDALNTLELKKYYVICPTLPSWDKHHFKAVFNGKELPTSFSYRSEINQQWLFPEQLREQIELYVEDPASNSDYVKK